MYSLCLYKNVVFNSIKIIKNNFSFLPIEKKIGSAGDSKQEFIFLSLTLSTTITTGPVYNVTLHMHVGMVVLNVTFVGIYKTRRDNKILWLGSYI